MLVRVTIPIANGASIAKFKKLTPSGFLNLYPLVGIGFKLTTSKYTNLLHLITCYKFLNRFP